MNRAGNALLDLGIQEEQRVMLLLPAIAFLFARRLRRSPNLSGVVLRESERGLVWFMASRTLLFLLAGRGSIVELASSVQS